MTLVQRDSLHTLFKGKGFVSKLMGIFSHVRVKGVFPLAKRDVRICLKWRAFVSTSTGGLPFFVSESI